MPVILLEAEAFAHVAVTLTAFETVVFIVPAVVAPTKVLKPAYAICTRSHTAKVPDAPVVLQVTNASYVTIPLVWLAVGVHTIG